MGTGHRWVSRGLCAHPISEYYLGHTGSLTDSLGRCPLCGASRESCGAWSADNHDHLATRNMIIITAQEKKTSPEFLLSPCP